MAKPKQPKRVVWGHLANNDLSENFDHTAYHWGLVQAERYLDFIQSHAQMLAEEPLLGKIVGDTDESDPPLRASFVRWPKARYGHYIVYIPTDYGVFIVRFLHSSQDMLGRLKGTS